MALSFNCNYFIDGTSDGIPIARLGQKIIYYVKCPINIIKEQINPERGFMMVTALVNRVAKELKISGMTAKKLNEIDHAIYNDIVPRGDIARKIYYEVKNRIAELESKMWRRPEGSENELQIIPPCTKNQATHIYAAGSAGSYKSTHAGLFGHEWYTVHPKGRVFIFSQKESDEAYDDLIPAYTDKAGGLIREPIDRSFLTKIEECNADKLLEGYKNSLIIFDDIESIMDDDISKAIFHFKDLCLLQGRCKGIDVCTILHKALSGKKSMVDINESTHLLFFPWKNNREIISMLKDYCKFKPAQINNIMDPETADTEWMCIVKPKIVVTKDYVKILNY